MAQFVSRFAEPGDPEYAPSVQEAETPLPITMSFLFGIVQMLLYIVYKKANSVLVLEEPKLHVLEYIIVHMLITTLVWDAREIIGFSSPDLWFCNTLLLFRC